MVRRTWYQVHQQLHGWTGGRRKDTDLHQAFVKGLEGTIPGSTPRPISRAWEGGGASDQALRKYSLFVQYVARIEQLQQEPLE